MPYSAGPLSAAHRPLSASAQQQINSGAGHAVPVKLLTPQLPDAVQDTDKSSSIKAKTQVLHSRTSKPGGRSESGSGKSFMLCRKI